MHYTIRKGDTLGKIAEAKYGDAALYKKLAAFNGILDANRISVGQAIEIPPKRILLGESVIESEELEISPPNGLNEIIAIFGDLYRYIREDGTIHPNWEAEYLSLTALPFPIPLSWNREQSVRRILCHKKLIEVFVDTFDEIIESGAEKTCCIIWRLL